jgi:hypothetical protein
MMLDTKFEQATEQPTKAEALRRLMAMRGNLTLKQCDEVHRLMLIVSGKGRPHGR